MSSVEWSPVLSAQESHNVPGTRHKHAICFDQSHLYVLAGKQGNIPLKDFWKYDIVSEKWEKLHNSGYSLPALQQHTMVVTGQKIYVFGGELAISNDTPLWIYDIPEKKWYKWSSITPDPGGGDGEGHEFSKNGQLRKKERIHMSFGELSSSPGGRRGHTALLVETSLGLGSGMEEANSQMLIFGGHNDLHGSTDELWAFFIRDEKWRKLGCYGEAPAPRHGHSAVLHDGQMWVYGGMTDLCERNDLWKYHIGVGSWQCVRSRPNPGTRHSHCATVLKSSMLVFAGKTEDKPMNDLWRYHFGTSSWQQLMCPGVIPQPRSQFSAFVAMSHHSNPSLMFTGFGSENGIGNHLNLRKISGANSSNYSQESSGYSSACSSSYSRNGYSSRIRSHNLRRISPEDCATGSASNRISSARSSLCLDDDSDDDLVEENIEQNQQSSLIKNKNSSSSTNNLMLSIAKLPQINVPNIGKYNNYSLLASESSEVTREEVIDYCRKRDKIGSEIVIGDANKINFVSENVEPNHSLTENSSMPDIDSQLIFKEDINLLGEPNGFSITRKTINYNYKKGKKNNNYKSFHNPNYVYYNSERELVEILPAVEEKDSSYQDHVDDLEEIKHKEFAKMLGASPSSKTCGVLQLQKWSATSSEEKPRANNLNDHTLELDNNTDQGCAADYSHENSNGNTVSKSPSQIKEAWVDTGNEKTNDESQIENKAMFIVGGKEWNDYTIFKRPISMWKLEVSFE